MYIRQQLVLVIVVNQHEHARSYIAARFLGSSTAGSTACHETLVFPWTIEYSYLPDAEVMVCSPLTGT